MPTCLLPHLMELPADRYQFETEMLLVTHRTGVAFSEVTIRTIYEDGNRSSHFRPIVDSAKIYGVFGAVRHAFPVRLAREPEGEAFPPSIISKARAPRIGGKRMTGLTLPVYNRAS